MKKLFWILTFVVLTGCTCIGQIPTQYAYINDECTAILPDYIPILIIADNCEIASITQIPTAGETLLGTTQVSIVAIDVSGNESKIYFDVILIDTVSPTIQLNPSWVGYILHEESNVGFMLHGDGDSDDVDNTKDWPYNKYFTGAGFSTIKDDLLWYPEADRCKLIRIYLYLQKEAAIGLKEPEL